MVARRAHNPKVVGSNPASATKKRHLFRCLFSFFSNQYHKTSTDYETEGRISEGTEHDRCLNGRLRKCAGLCSNTIKTSVLLYAMFELMLQMGVGSNPASATKKKSTLSSAFLFVFVSLDATSFCDKVANTISVFT